MTPEQVLAWEPDRLASVADDLAEDRRRLTDLQDEVDGARPPDDWVGADADAARASHGRLYDQLADLVSPLSRVVDAFDTAAREIRHAQTTLADTQQAIRGRGWTSEFAGGQFLVTPDPDAGEGATGEAERLAGQLADAFRQAVQADATLAGVLQSAARGKYDTDADTLAGAAAPSGSGPGGTGGDTFEDILQSLDLGLTGAGGYANYMRYVRLDQLSPSGVQGSRMTPEAARQRARWSQASRWTVHLSGLTTGLTEAWTQWRQDTRNDPDMGAVEQGARSTVKGTATAGGTWLGGTLSSGIAKEVTTAALRGSRFGPWGTAIAATVAGIYGGVKGTEAGQAVGDWANEQVSRGFDTYEEHTPEQVQHFLEDDVGAPLTDSVTSTYNDWGFRDFAEGMGDLDESMGEGLGHGWDWAKDHVAPIPGETVDKLREPFTSGPFRSE